MEWMVITRSRNRSERTSFALLPRCQRRRRHGADWGSTAISTLTLLFDNRNGDNDRISFLSREGSFMEALVVLGQESNECGAPHRFGHVWPEHTGYPISYSALRHHSVPFEAREFSSHPLPLGQGVVGIPRLLWR